jgi:hypothetical protein
MSAGGTLLVALGNLGSAIGKTIGNALMGIMGGVINGVIDAINSFKIDFQGVDLGPLGKIAAFHWGGMNLQRFNVPTFATGAWELASNQLAMLHKGEMVVPAVPAQQLRQTWAQSAGSHSGSGGEYHIHTHIYLDGKQIAENVDKRQGLKFLLGGSSQNRPLGA